MFNLFINRAVALIMSINTVAFQKENCVLSKIHYHTTLRALLYLVTVSVNLHNFATVPNSWCLSELIIVENTTTTTNITTNTNTITTTPISNSGSIIRTGKMISP